MSTGHDTCTSTRNEKHRDRLRTIFSDCDSSEPAFSRCSFTLDNTCVFWSVLLGGPQGQVSESEQASIDLATEKPKFIEQ